MKPFLGIDLTTDKKNERMNGEELLVAKPALALTQSFERFSENAEETIEKSKLPLPIRIGQWVCGMIGLIIFVSVAKTLGGEDDVTLAQAYQNAPWLFWLGGGCLMAWGLLKLISVRKAKSVLETNEGTQTFQDLDQTCDAILADLAVPSSAKEIDVLAFFYKIKDNTVKVVEKGFQVAPYLNPIFHAFADDENLYLANLEGKYAIPLSAIQAIRSVKKTIRIMDWNKDEPHNSDVYKPYKLSEDDHGRIACKLYHIVEFVHNDELWGVYIPCYELPVIEELTGMKAESI